MGAATAVGLLIGGLLLVCEAPAAENSKLKSDPGGRDPLDVFFGSGRTGTVPREEIRRGGPMVDGIPPIDRPKFLSAGEAGFLRDEDDVLGVVVGGEARAYPLRILNWHEIVNDTVGGRPVVVSYCPLCRSGLAFDRVVAGSTRTFGVSGLLYQSDVVMYDRETLTLWSQIAQRGIHGPDAGTSLTPVPCAAATWAAWRRTYPGTQVLSTETGVRRNYDRDPYAGYAADPGLYFPVGHEDDRLPRKTLVLGASRGGEAKAWPLWAVRDRKRIADFVGRDRVEVRAEDGIPRVFLLPTGEEIPATVAFWFAWAAFHPGTGLLAPWPARHPAP